MGNQQSSSKEFFFLMLTGKTIMPRLLTSVTLPLRLINTAENLFVMSTCTRIFIVSSSIYVLEMHVMGHLKHIFPSGPIVLQHNENTLIQIYYVYHHK